MNAEETLKSFLAVIEGTVPADMATGDQCRDYLVRLTSMMAYANEARANANRAYNVAKSQAYISLEREILGQHPKFAPSLAKDYVAALCSKECYAYDLADRCSATITHTIDAFRSVLSSLKAEQQFAQYGH